MASWEVRTRNNAVQVEGANWLLAVGVALPALDLDAGVLSRLVCDVQADGVVRILDPVSRTPLLVRRLPDQVGPDGARRVVPVGVVAVSGAPPEDDSTEIPTQELGPDAITSEEIDVTAPPPPALHLPAPTDSPEAMNPTLAAPAAPPAAASSAVAATAAASPASADPTELPATSAAPPPPPPRVPSVVPVVPHTRVARFSAADIATLDDIQVPSQALEGQPGASAGPPADLAEQLFLKGMDIYAAADITEAARITLSALEAVVPVEAGSVLYAGLNDTGLRFLAADGPSAAEVMDITVPMGHGIAGFCHVTGASLVIRNVAQDPRHLHEVDDQTGFHTRDLLSVALRDEQGGIHGCIQLLNPPGGFAEWHLEAAGTLAATLAEYMRGRT